MINESSKKTILEKPDLIPATILAYVGDAVYELAVRKHLISRGISKMDKLHREAVRYVRASTQAEMLYVLEDYLSGEELAVVRRGRNAKTKHCPKGAGVVEYRYSTAFESLFGYLYLKGDKVRIRELLDKVFSRLDSSE